MSSSWDNANRSMMDRSSSSSYAQWKTLNNPPVTVSITKTNLSSSASNVYDNLELTFAKCLREIEKSYKILTKPLRIRVEKWVEKLVVSGSNGQWRKHRNAYARLLLNMIIAQKMTEPFHTQPPDGPLPTFPFHLRSFSKDLLGSHEASFWKGLYDGMQQSAVNSHMSGAKDIASHYDNSADATRYSRELASLSVLVQEQQEKIRLLEEQLREERIRHELQLQRLLFTHRAEMEQLLSKSLRPNASNVTSTEGFTQPSINRYPTPLKNSSSLPMKMSVSPEISRTRNSDQSHFNGIQFDYKTMQNLSSAEENITNDSLNDGETDRAQLFGQDHSRQRSKYQMNDIFPKPSSTTTPSNHNKEEISPEEDFLKYIEDFQSHLVKKVSDK